MFNSSLSIFTWIFDFLRWRNYLLCTTRTSKSLNCSSLALATTKTYETQNILNEWIVDVFFSSLGTYFCLHSFSWSRHAVNILRRISGLTQMFYYRLIRKRIIKIRIWQIYASCKRQITDSNERSQILRLDNTAFVWPHISEKICTTVINIKE